MQRRVLNGIAAVFVVVVVVVIAVSAVGAFTGGGTGSTGRVETGVVRISIKGLAFSRGTRTVAVGTTVVWTNRDSTAHTVTANANGAFDSRNLEPGRSFSHTFSQRGSFDYRCTIHPFMKGTIMVVLPYGPEPK